MRAALLLSATLLATAACQEPFGTDRHDLVGLRVAAITVTPLAEDQVQLGLAAVVDGRPWADAPLDLAWHDATGLTREEIGSLPASGGIASGPAPIVPGTGPGRLALVASDGDRVWRGTVELPEVRTLSEPPSLDPIVARPLDRRLPEQTGTDLDLEARRAWTLGEPVDRVDAGAWVRLRVAADEDVEVRWMSTAPSGRFLELDAQATDWVAARYVRDDEDLEDVELGAEGPRTLLALGLDPENQGANAWTARELFVGEVPVGLFTPSGRWIATDAPMDASFVRGTIVADDASPTGIRLDGAEPAGSDDDPGTPALPCTVPVDGPFDPDWLLSQRCLRTQVTGASVVVQVRR